MGVMKDRNHLKINSQTKRGSGSMKRSSPKNKKKALAPPSPNTLVATLATLPNLNSNGLLLSLMPVSVKNNLRMLKQIKMGR
jgi:hypothetical protein